MRRSGNGEALLDAEDVVAQSPLDWALGLETLGHSRQGRPILGFEAGHGSILVTAIGGCHADEPVGPAMLERLIRHLRRLPSEHPLLSDHLWRIVPHVNPDGEAKNRDWTQTLVKIRDHAGQPDFGYDLSSYLKSVVRELPGDDIEFGFPSSWELDPRLRPENLAVATFLTRPTEASAGRIALHGSLHGMGLASGPWFLLEPDWIDRTAALRQSLATATASMGYRLFDADRHGEKGFRRIATGFSTRPDSRAMREYFLARNDRETARKFRPSSMELARRCGDDPLTLVSEMPLFVVASLSTGPTDLSELQAARDRLTRAAISGRSELETVATKLGVAPMPIRDQMRLQARLLDEGLRAVRFDYGLPD